MLEIPAKIEFDPINITKKHETQSSWKTTVMCNIKGDIDKYYSWFLKKRFNLELNRPLRDAHITIINDKITDKEAYNRAKEIWNGRETIFTFDPEEIRTNGTHWWIKVYNNEVAQIRMVAGVTPIPYFNLHLTLGYANEKNEAHSQYILRQIMKFNL